MTKRYKLERKSNLVVSIIQAIFYGGLIIYAASSPQFRILDRGPAILLLIFVAIVLGFISFYPLIVSVTGFLELNDEVLSRTHLGIKVWHIKVAQIIDIYKGNTAHGNSGGQSMGLTFRTEFGEKRYWRQIPYSIQISDELGLISDLTAINKNIKFHNNPSDLLKFWGMPTL